MNIRPMQISEIYRNVKETITESIKHNAIKLYPVFLVYSLTTIFLLWIAKIVLF